ncbi:phospholipase C, phosphocholine-specific [Variovorax guangxiensis]|uniref:phospholipase C n=1 Tax=Variovorax guangxiensis TaxID=1775474 RepID=A0A3S0XRP8_9BURK|nr:phospholipase C, phosphocholine-specific [Variovorax guangxiensis]RUR67834.1 phospholipase C, phosphocholine-specific [Variovorax guangxiensis]
MTNSRRKFLTGTATTGAAALALSAFPPSIRRALAIPANNKTGTIKDVEHVVILMQENRSFDHYFGTLMGVRGFGDRFTIPLPKGMNVWQQADGTGNTILPYHLDKTKGNALRSGQTPHDWSDGQNAWDGGRNYQWPRYKSTLSMGYYKEAELPYQRALANAFTLCDGYHCSMHAGTNSNRMFVWTGSNGPTGAGVATVTNEWDDSYTPPSTTGYEWKTYPERLQAAGVSWIVYENMRDNFGDNPLTGFKQYRRASEASSKPVSSSGPVLAYDPASDDVGNPLYKGIANTMPGTKVDEYLNTFRNDVKNNKLPQVSWIVAPATYSEHPGPSSPVQGAWYIQQVLDALTAVPEVWSKTVLFINFDENDGFFDHYPSPAAPSINPDGTPAGKTTLSAAELAFEYHNYPAPPGTTKQKSYPPDGRVFGPGKRVPMYVVSPWSRGGWVNSQAFDHTSVLRFIETCFGVAEPNISPFRRAVCGDLTSAFNFANPNDEPLPTLAGRNSLDEANQQTKLQEYESDGVTKRSAVPLPLDPQLPRQATGSRPSRALPYELHVSGRSDAVKGQMRLIFKNSGKAAAVFHVYDKLNLDRLPRRYMVEPGKQLDDTWNPGADNSGFYDLWVLGPNGFHRHFKGDLNRLRAGGAPDPEVRVCYDITNGNVSVEMLNGASGTARFTVRAKAYRDDGPWTATVAGGAKAEQAWVLANSGQWYDFAVTCDSDPAFYRRFAGRVETGRHSVSDPAMGLADL